MALIIGSATVPSGTTGTLIFRIPAGQCNVTFWNIGAVTTWIGTGTATTSANGVQCHSIPTSFNTYIGNAGGGLYATTGSTAAASAATVQYILNSSF